MTVVYDLLDLYGLPFVEGISYLNFPWISWILIFYFLPEKLIIWPSFFYQAYHGSCYIYLSLFIYILSICYDIYHG